MIKVALTGGIATGKSYVLARLRDRGVPTIDADEIVHEALGPGTITTNTIALQLGTAPLKPDGSIDRALLGEKVFADADARRRLEAIVHPHVYETIRSWFARDDRPLGVASIPLLYETHHEADFDAVVVTSCRAEQQLQRVMERDGLTEDEARRRIAAQIPTEEKVRRADFVVTTSGTTLETDRQVDELLVKLRAPLAL
jgi:dephospho-CoA kinase